MAIARPITKSIISTTAWGIPITDQVNANTTDIAALKPSGWTGVTFSNGWNNMSGWSPVQYRKMGDMVYLRGNATGGTVGTVAFTLPVGFRPPGHLSFTIPMLTGSVWGFGYLEQLSTGVVYLYMGGNANVGINYSFSTTV